MKRLIDISCSSCSRRQYDVYVDASYPDCDTCGAPMERLWVSSGRPVGDDIPGGLVLEHGLCWRGEEAARAGVPEGTPRRYDTKSAIARDAKKAGLHWGAFLHGSPSGRRWV
jgi:hypothetical protein